jgi:hypothetical protein
MSVQHRAMLVRERREFERACLGKTTRRLAEPAFRPAGTLAHDRLAQGAVALEAVEVLERGRLVHHGTNGIHRVSIHGCDRTM